MKTARLSMVLLAGFFLLSCAVNTLQKDEYQNLSEGGATGEEDAMGGTDTGTTDPRYSSPSSALSLGRKIQSAAGALLPEISASESSGLSALTIGRENEWERFLNTDGGFLLTDIFGDPNEGFAVVTKIRVLLDQIRREFEYFLSSDPDLSCRGSQVLKETDSLEVAFFGDLDNGDEGDRRYRCLSRSSHWGTVLYGRDSQGVVRLVEMDDKSRVNTEEKATRGNRVRHLHVTAVTVKEELVEENRLIQVDVQYNQATLYSGPDDVYGTNDDEDFKSRSRISGIALLDGSLEALDGLGEFTITKYGRALNPEARPYTTITLTTGRGDFGDQGLSLFRIDTDISKLANLPDRVFCLEQSVDSPGRPLLAAYEDCVDLEEAFAWDETEFTLDLSPVLEPIFIEKDFFGADDLIENDSSNFQIPDYEVEEEEENEEEENEEDPIP